MTSNVDLQENPRPMIELVLTTTFPLLGETVRQFAAVPARPKDSI